MTDLFTPAGADAVRDLLKTWPDDAERADERKVKSYWDYFERKRKAFGGTFAFGVHDGSGEPRFIAIAFDDAGEAVSVRIVDEAEAVAEAKLAILASYEDWTGIVGGYDIGKAMTYHQLPLRVGGATEMLRYAYFVHELIVVFTRVAGADRVAA